MRLLSRLNVLKHQSSRIQSLSLGILLLAGVQLWSGSGCGGIQDAPTETPVASPPTEFGESIEDQYWSGWHTYQDDMVDMHLLTRILIFEYRDGLWCGELIIELGVPGSYLAYNLGEGWVTVIDVPYDSPGEDVFNLARLYGTLEQSPTGRMLVNAWMDSINDHVPATPSEEQPPMEFASIFFGATFQENVLNLDPSDATLAEFMAYTADYPHMERTTATDPATVHIDMPPYPLTYTGPFASGIEDEYCAWCMQPGDETVYEPM